MPGKLGIHSSLLFWGPSPCVPAHCLLFFHFCREARLDFYLKKWRSITSNNNLIQGRGSQPRSTKGLEKKKPGPKASNPSMSSAITHSVSLESTREQRRVWRASVNNLFSLSIKLCGFFLFVSSPRRTKSSRGGFLDISFFFFWVVLSALYWSVKICSGGINAWMKYCSWRKGGGN